MATTIQISDEVWNNLNRLKLRGETFNDVLTNLINNDQRIKLNKEAIENETSDKIS